MTQTELQQMNQDINRGLARIITAEIVEADNRSDVMTGLALRTELREIETLNDRNFIIDQGLDVSDAEGGF